MAKPTSFTKPLGPGSVNDLTLYSREHEKEVLAVIFLAAMHGILPPPWRQIRNRTTLAVAYYSKPKDPGGFF